MWERPSWKDGRCDGIEGRKGSHRSRYEKRMGTIPMTIWRMIEILLTSLGMWSRWKKGFEVPIVWGHEWLHLSASENDLGMRRRRKSGGSAFQRRAGFYNLKSANWKSPPGSLSLFLPYRVPLNPRFYLSHHRLLSSRIWRPDPFNSFFWFVRRRPARPLKAGWRSAAQGRPRESCGLQGGESGDWPVSVNRLTHYGSRHTLFSM